MYMGTVIAMPLAGILAQYVSWEAIFYVFGEMMMMMMMMTVLSGLLALVWCLLWWLCVEDSPDQDSAITDQELEYLRTTIGLTDPRSEGSCYRKYLMMLKIFVPCQHGPAAAVARDADEPRGVGHHHRALHRELGLLHSPHLPPDVSA